MTPETRERMNLLCQGIQEERDPATFNKLITELNELLAAFQSRLYRNIQDEEWIEEFREAIVNWNPPVQRHFLRPVLAAATLRSPVL